MTRLALIVKKRFSVLDAPTVTGALNHLVASV